MSVEPSFPSTVEGTDDALADIIADDPLHWLGFDFGLGNTSLLVKLLDTADELSVQIHPSDDYAPLKSDESGKPESWYVVHAEPGAGLYLGLREGVTQDDMATVLADEGDLAALLHFVEVAPGDFFVIEAGTPHAIGRGLTLVEPQRVLPGRRGLTYRYWDWNRRYDDKGVRDDNGAPRELHVEDALAVTRFDRARGDAFIAEVRRRAPMVELESAATFLPLSDRVANDALRFAPLSVGRVAGTGGVRLPPSDVLRAITVVAGTIEVDGETCDAGGSMVIAARGGDVELGCDHVHAVVSASHA